MIAARSTYVVKIVDSAGRPYWVGSRTSDGSEWLVSRDQARRLHSSTEAIEEFQTFAFLMAVGFRVVIEMA